MKRVITAFLFGSIWLNAPAQTLCGRRSVLLRQICIYKSKAAVPNEAAAIQLAVGIWIKVYGEKQIKNEQPYHAKLTGSNIWHVCGSLPNGLWSGSVAEADISKNDGKIINVCHGQ